MSGPYTSKAHPHGNLADGVIVIKAQSPRASHKEQVADEIDRRFGKRAPLIVWIEPGADIDTLNRAQSLALRDALNEKYPL